MSKFVFTAEYFYFTNFFGKVFSSFAVKEFVC